VFSSNCTTNDRQKVVKAFVFIIMLTLAFHNRFSSGENRGGSIPRGPEITHDLPQPLIVSSAVSHEDGTKPGRRCDHTLWCLADLCAAFLWVQPALAEFFLFGEVALHSGLNEFHSCALPSHGERQSSHNTAHQSPCSAFRHWCKPSQGTIHCSVFPLTCSVHWLRFLERHHTSVF